MKRSQKNSSGNQSIKKPKLTPIMDQIVTNPGLQHIIEIIFLNLDFEDLQGCQLVNKSCKKILENPMFWLKKWRLFRGLSKKNQADWAKAIQITRNTSVEINVDRYLKKVIKNGHSMDVPCYIDSDVVNKDFENIYRIIDTRQHTRNFGVIQILAPMMNIERNAREIRIAACDGNVDVVKILAPLAKNLNLKSEILGRTAINIAAVRGHVDVLKLLAPLTKNLDDPDNWGRTPILSAVIQGHVDVVKYLAPLTANPKAPIKKAAELGHDEIVKILQHYT